jgi:signal transduction histidine kinase
VPVKNEMVSDRKVPQELKITTNIVPRSIVKAQGSPVINFLSNNKTINDSIPVNQVDSAYRVELLKANRNIPFRILFYSYQDSLAKTRIAAKKDTLSDVFSEQVITGFKVPYSYQATFNQTMPYVLSKMRMQIGGSVILLLLVTISFIVLYRNMMAQHRLAVMKNDFISNITHELKTPIATVGVAIEALKNFDAIKNPERTKEYLDISASELQRLSLLVDKVLKLSMFEKKQLELNKEPFDLKELLTETMAIMRLQFEKHKAAVSFVCEEGSYMLEADKLHITSVIYNLLDNALKYSPGKPAIQVKLSATNEHQLQLDIIDNGMGIASQHQSRIFEKFFRVPTGNQHNIKGYGLGLSYVAEVVKSHNGSIRLHSEEGKGSTFSILLPAYSS